MRYKTPVKPSPYKASRASSAQKSKFPSVKSLDINKIDKEVEDILRSINALTTAPNPEEGATSVLNQRSQTNEALQESIKEKFASLKSENKKKDKQLKALHSKAQAALDDVGGRSRRLASERNKLKKQLKAVLLRAEEAEEAVLAQAERVEQAQGEAALLRKAQIEDEKFKQNALATQRELAARLQRIQEENGRLEAERRDPPIQPVGVVGAKNNAFTQVLEVINAAAGKNLPAIQAKNSAVALLSNFIADRNKPENTKPQEYSGVGVEMQGVEVTVASKDSALKLGDKIIAVSVDKTLGLSPELQKFVAGNILDLQNIKDPERLSEACALAIRGMPGTSAVLKVVRGGKVMELTVKRQLFGISKGNELVAFTTPDEIAPSKEMSELLLNIEKIESKGAPHSMVGAAIHHPPLASTVNRGSAASAAG